MTTIGCSKHFIPYYGLFLCDIQEWRSIRLIEINQYDITMATHYDITMGNNVARHIYCDVTMSNDVAICISWHHNT